MAQPMFVMVGQKVLLSGSGSNDAESPRGNLRYSWDFGNNGRTVDATTEQTTASYGRRGYRTVKLTVFDEQGLSDTTTLPIVITKRVTCETTSVHRHGPWREVRSKQAPGGSYCDNRGHRTKKAHRADSMSVAFSGNTVRVDYGTFHGGGSAKVFVDGKAAGRISFAGGSTAPKFGQHKLLGYFGKGNHRLRLVFSGKAAIDSFVF